MTEREDSYIAGTTEGGKKAARTNKARYGEDFYVVNGAKGGRNGNTGGFASSKELARRAGRIGGRISKSGKKSVGKVWDVTPPQSLATKLN